MSDQVWEDERITAYIFGALTGDDLIEFEKQLSADVALRDAVAEAREITDSVSDVYASDSVDELTPDRRAEIDQAVGTSEAHVSIEADETTFSASRWIPIAAIAATFLAILAAASYIDVSMGTQTAEKAKTPPRPDVVVSTMAQENEEISEFSIDEIETEATAESLSSLNISLTEGLVPAEQPVQVSAGKSLGYLANSPAIVADEINGRADAEAVLSKDFGMEMQKESELSLPYASRLFKSANSPNASVTNKRGTRLTEESRKNHTNPYGRQPANMVEPGIGVSGPGPGKIENLSEKMDTTTDFSGEIESAEFESKAPADLSIASQVEERVRIQQTEGKLRELNVQFSVDSGVVRLSGTIDPSQRVALHRAVRDATGVKDIVDQTRDRYENFGDNPFRTVGNDPLSTFSIDVDTASYSKVRMYLNQHNTLPRPDAVRIEELVNYFEYDYATPKKKDDAFAASMEIASCPWNPAHRLARVAIKGREIENEKRPSSNLVFLLDVSGSMDSPNKLPLVKRGMQMLLDKLGENDRVSIVVYAGAAGLVLDSTTANNRQVIYDALERLNAGGSTNGGEGIQLAYQMARDHFVTGGTNRVILCTDGDFNVGTTETGDLVSTVEKEAAGGVFLTVLGFGMGNHNDEMLEKISGRGNGNYAFIDTDSEAHKVLVQQISSTLVTIAKNVKIQVEFNPSEVSAYRLIGYENRILAKEDFNDDKKDAGEIGAGHTVTAFYEIVPAGESSPLETPDVDDLKYQKKNKLSKASTSGELLTLKIRHMLPEANKSTLQEFAITDDGKKFDKASTDFQFAASVASFGMLLRNSPHKGNATYAGIAETASTAKGEDAFGLRDEFLKMVRRAGELSGE